MRHAAPQSRLRPILAGAAATGLVIAGVAVGVAQWRSGTPDAAPVAAAETVDAVAAPQAARAPAAAEQARVPAIGRVLDRSKRTRPTTSAPRPTGSTQPAPPPAPAGGKPGPGNTGAGSGLRVVTGDQTYSTAGQVVSGVDVHGKIRITGKNVTLRNVIARGPTGGGCTNSAVIEVRDGGSATIEDVTVVASNPTACLDGISAMNTTIVRADISNVVDGIKAYDDVTVRDSYVHDLKWFASDPNQGGGETHNDAVQTWEGNANILLRHNTLLAGTKGNAALQVTQDGGGRATNIRVENNWVDGGGCTLNFAHKGGPTPMTGITVTANRFGRTSAFNCPVLVSTQTQITLSANVYDDTNTAIPTPQRHD